MEKEEIVGRSDVGALRLRTIATKDRPCADFPYMRQTAEGQREYDPAVVLDLDYTVLMPRRAAAKPARKAKAKAPAKAPAKAKKAARR
jgi:2-methylfumaryl-CoA hydratase